MIPPNLNDETLLRANQLVGPQNYDPAKHGPKLLPFGRSKWFSDLRKGVIPAGVKLGARTTVYRWGDVRKAYGLPAPVEGEAA